VLGFSGDRLPYSSRFSGNFSIDQRFPLGNGVTGYLGGSLSYLGVREGAFEGASTQRQTFPAYTKADLRASVKYESWMLTAYVNNLTDKRGIIQSGIATGVPNGFYYIQPRMVGLSFTARF
jgi:iron complex outermembrane receptor protein